MKDRLAVGEGYGLSIALPFRRKEVQTRLVREYKVQWLLHVLCAANTEVVIEARWSCVRLGGACQISAIATKVLS